MNSSISSSISSSVNYVSFIPVSSKLVLLITHTDLDGIAAALLAYRFSIVSDIYSWANGYTSEEIIFSSDKSNKSYKYDKIYVVDRAIPEEILSLSTLPDITILDHHACNRYIEKYPTCICDTSRCGTRLLWEEVIKPRFTIEDSYESTIEDFVLSVDAYDRWIDTSEYFEKGLNLNRIFEYFVEYSTIKSELILKDGCIQKSKFSQLIEKLNSLIINSSEYGYIELECEMKNETGENFISAILTEMKNRERKNYNRTLQTLKIREDEDGNKFGIIEGLQQSSLVANKIIKENPSLMYVLIYYQNNLTKLSARSNKDKFDLNNLNGFHGHPGAAGGCFDQNWVIRLINGEVKPRMKSKMGSGIRTETRSESYRNHRNHENITGLIRFRYEKKEKK